MVLKTMAEDELPGIVIEQNKEPRQGPQSIHLPRMQTLRPLGSALLLTLPSTAKWACFILFNFIAKLLFFFNV